MRNQFIIVAFITIFSCSKNQKPIQLLNNLYSCLDIDIDHKGSFPKGYRNGIVDTFDNEPQTLLGVSGNIKTVYCNGKLASVFFYPDKNHILMLLSSLEDSLNIKIQKEQPVIQGNLRILYSTDKIKYKIFEVLSLTEPVFISWTDMKFCRECANIENYHQVSY